MNKYETGCMILYYFLCILLVLISIYHVQIGSTAFREGEIIIRGDPCATEKSLCWKTKMSFTLYLAIFK